MRWAASFPERVGRFTWEEDERAAYLLVGLRYDGHLFFPANRWHRLCLICSLFSGCIVKCSLDEPAKSFVAVIVFHWRSQRHQRTRTAVHQRGAHRLGRHEGIHRQPLGIIRWRRWGRVLSRNALRILVTELKKSIGMNRIERATPLQAPQRTVWINPSVSMKALSNRHTSSTSLPEKSSTNLGPAFFSQDWMETRVPLPKVSAVRLSGRSTKSFYVTERGLP